MPNITLEKIDNLLTEIEYGELITIPYDNYDFSVNVKTVLTELEKKTFVERVVSNSYVNNIEYSSIDNRNAFIATFAQIFTDLPIPTKQGETDVVDIDKLCAIVNGLDLITNAKLISKIFCDTLNELEMCIKQEIAFKNAKLIALYAQSTATSEAIESVSYLVNKALDGVNKACDILDNVKDLSKDGKFLKVIPKKKLDQIFDRVQKIVDSVVYGLKQDNGAVIDKMAINMQNILKTKK